MKNTPERRAGADFRNQVKIRNSVGGRFADYLTRAFGTVWFLAINAIFFALWILINTGVLPILPTFDPFPFTLLIMFVSLEAIFLSTIVLISQNRASYIADIREEIDFEINIKAEAEITRAINMLDEIHDHLGLPPLDDAELAEMKQKTDIKEITDRLLNRKK